MKPILALAWLVARAVAVPTAPLHEPVEIKRWSDDWGADKHRRWSDDWGADKHKRWSDDWGADKHKRWSDDWGADKRDDPAHQHES